MSNSTVSTTSNNPYQDLGLSCSFGGSFYICSGEPTEFIGCCTSDPCLPAQRGVCPTSNLRNSSFNADAYHDIPPQQCSSENGDWYTCTGTVPPFIGCCSVNPCQRGSCPVSNVIPAELSIDPSAREVFLEAMSSATSASGTSGSAATSTASASSGSGGSSSGIGTGAIVGIVVGAIAVTGMIIGFFIWKLKRRRSQGLNPETRTSAAFLNPATSISPGQHIVHPSSMTPPVNVSPDYQMPMMYAGGNSPPIMGNYNHPQYTDANGMPIPHDAYAVSQGIYSQNIGKYGHQSVSTLATDFSNGQRNSEISQVSGQQSPGFVSNMAPVSELDGAATTPVLQEMPEATGTPTETKNTQSQK
ncbi:hypothetical protein HOO65_020453 [Ceratocystis lukuohia]|uniref:Uncharacterized protein n=1 Tax=Ceratocystis lukuohia TaxID=2019550 RepID=A0ABR4MNS9_9PEZI